MSAAANTASGGTSRAAARVHSFSRFKNFTKPKPYTTTTTAIAATVTTRRCSQGAAKSGGTQAQANATANSTPHTSDKYCNEVRTAPRANKPSANACAPTAYAATIRCVKLGTTCSIHATSSKTPMPIKKFADTSQPWPLPADVAESLRDSELAVSEKLPHVGSVGTPKRAASIGNRSRTLHNPLVASEYDASALASAQ